MKRENGFYWIRFNGWKVAEWEDGDWFVAGYHSVGESDFDEIIETRLEPPNV